MQGGRGMQDQFFNAQPRMNQQQQYVYPQQPSQTNRPGQVLTPLQKSNPTNPTLAQPPMDKNTCYKTGFTSKQDFLDRLDLFTSKTNTEDSKKGKKIK